MLHFFDVEGILVRRWVPGYRRVALETWTGEEWTPYPDVDRVSRYGRRLTHEEALALLQTARERSRMVSRFSDEEAVLVLSSRQSGGRASGRSA
jgi:hypothetical protein